ncbi:MAG: hypothetical protein K6T91_11450 [Firmicutes bacterium]|nr:hypothetical protein [Bacillota bacterium]
MDTSTNTNAKHSRLFYLGISLLLLFGFLIFSVFENSFNKTSGQTVSIPATLPLIAFIIFYEGFIKKRSLREIGIKKENFWRNAGVGALLAFFGFFVLFAIVKIAIPGLMEGIAGRTETVSVGGQIIWHKFGQIK